MDYRICPNSGLELSVLGIGCWSFGGGSYWGEQDQKDVNDVVHAAIDYGVNYFDTAELYNEGRSEQALGDALKGVSRDRVVIGSKVNPSNCYPDVLREHCEASLKKLQTDYMDLYMIHWPIHPHSVRSFTSDEEVIRNPPDLSEAYYTLLELRKEGKIRHIGVSNFSRGRLSEFPGTDLIAANELPYNLVSRAIEFDIMKYNKEKGIGIIAYNALMQGYLADRYPVIEDLPLSRRRTRHFDSRKNPQSRTGEPGFEEELNRAMEIIRRICRESGISMAELALGWVIANPVITCTLAGSRYREQLLSNIKSSEHPVSEDIISSLNDATRPLMEKMGNHFDYYEGAENDRTL